VSSGTIGSTSVSATVANGVRDAPIVDSAARRVYVFMGADNGATDVNGVTCSGVCSAVYQFRSDQSIATQNLGMGAGLGSKVNVGLSTNNNNLNRAISAGAFDDAYYNSADATNPSGFLYVCGSSPDVSRRPMLWRIAIAGNAFGARTPGPLLVNGNTTDGCSPLTAFMNPATGTEYLFVSVTSSGSAAGGGGCTTPASGCVYMYRLPMALFDATSASSTINSATARFMSVSTSAALNTTESSVATTLTAVQAGTYQGMYITQGAATPGGTNFTYTLRRNAGSQAITCAITAGNTACSDTTNAASFAAGDTMDIQVQRTGGTGTLTATFQVQLAGGAAAALNATGGTGGIIIDNAATGGGSQIYYSTRTSPGNAVQASQAGLQ
jgi:hypothetical protein